MRKSWSGLEFMYGVDQPHGGCRSTPVTYKKTSNLSSLKELQKGTTVSSTCKGSIEHDLYLYILILSHYLGYIWFIFRGIWRDKSVLLRRLISKSSMSYFYLCNLYWLWLCFLWSQMSNPPVSFRVKDKLLIDRVARVIYITLHLYCS